MHRLARAVAAGASVQHTIGVWDFAGIKELMVWPGQLCPRPETEELALLASAVLRLAGARPALSPEALLAQALIQQHVGCVFDAVSMPSPAFAAAVAEAEGLSMPAATSAAAGPRGRAPALLDLGTGTGAIVLAAVKGAPGSFGVGLDLTDCTVRAARSNAVAQGLDADTCMVCFDAGGDWSGAVGGALAAGAKGGQEPELRVVTANPPYLPPAAMASAAEHVTRSERERCLAGGGGDGLTEPLRWVAAVARAAGCVPRGALLGVELDPTQPRVLWRACRSGAEAEAGAATAAASSALLAGAPGRSLRWITAVRDHAGRDRFAWLCVQDDDGAAGAQAEPGPA